MGFEYSIKNSRRSRKVKIGIAGGQVVVTAPPRASLGYLNEIVRRHRAWIERALAKQQKLIAGMTLARERVDREEFFKKAERLSRQWHQTVSAPRGARFNKLSVRKMRSRWGSCSPDGNVSINLLLGHLPDGLLEYVIVHELCHLVHHNHSKNFWLLVAKHLPEYQTRKRELHRYGYLLKAAVPVRAAASYVIK